MLYRLLLMLVLTGPGIAVAKEAVLVLGDSISAAYGIDKQQGWVALLTDQLKQQCGEYRVINASVSGETTAGGRTRLPALLEQHEPELVVLELGGNDGLRGLSPTQMAENLRAMIAASRKAGANVVLLGIRIPPNYGEQYRRHFEAQFRQVAANTQTPLVPFLLDGVVEAGLLQRDGIHPTAEAQPRLLQNALQVIAPAVAAPCREALAEHQPPRKTAEGS